MTSVVIHFTAVFTLLKRPLYLVRLPTANQHYLKIITLFYILQEVFFFNANSTRSINFSDPIFYFIWRYLLLNQLRDCRSIYCALQTSKAFGFSLIHSSRQLDMAAFNASRSAAGLIRLIGKSHFSSKLYIVYLFSGLFKMLMVFHRKYCVIFNL